MVKTSTLFYFLDNRDQLDLCIETDKFIDDSFDNFDDVFLLLNQIEFEPSLKSIESILEYARK